MDIKEIINNTKIYSIAFTVRSGSNLLCDYLKLNGFGQPTEYFQYPFGVANRYHYENLGIPYDEFKSFFLNCLMKNSNNGLFGTKITWFHKNVLLAELKKHFDAHDINSLFSNVAWIYVRRRDKILQAISAWRAIKSGQWTSFEPVTGKQEPEYDFFKIISQLQFILIEEFMWEIYFNMNKITPFQVFYEDLIENPKDVLFSVIQHIQFATGKQIIFDKNQLSLASSYSMQRSQYSEEIKERFINDLHNMEVAGYWGQRESQYRLWMDFFALEGWNKL